MLSLCSLAPRLVPPPPLSPIVRAIASVRSQLSMLPSHSSCLVTTPSLPRCRLASLPNSPHKSKALSASRSPSPPISTPWGVRYVRKTAPSTATSLVRQNYATSNRSPHSNSSCHRKRPVPTPSQKPSTCSNRSTGSTPSISNHIKNQLPPAFSRGGMA